MEESHAGTRTECAMRHLGLDECIGHAAEGWHAQYKTVRASGLVTDLQWAQHPSRYIGAARNAKNQ